MVFLAITPRGLEDALREATKSATPVWCGADAISEEDWAGEKRKPDTLHLRTWGARPARPARRSKYHRGTSPR